MKKLFSLLLVLFLLTGSACASTAVTIAKYNSLAYTYGAPVLDSDMITNEATFLCGDMIISFDQSGATILAPDSADFLPACVCAALTVATDTTGSIGFMGDLLYSYMTVKSGKNADPMFFNSMCFYVSSTGNGLLFFIGDP